MSGRTVAFRYAAALYAVASEKQIVETIISDFTKIKEILTAEPIRNYCLQEHENKLSVMSFVETAFIPYVSQLTGEMLKLVVRNGRLAAIPYFFSALKQIIDAQSGTVEVVLESARKPEESMQKNIQDKMQARLGKKIKFSNIVVPELLGGIRLLWNNRLIDLSVSGRLKKMRALLKSD